MSVTDVQAMASGGSTGGGGGSTGGGGGSTGGGGGNTGGGDGDGGERFTNGKRTQSQPVSRAKGDLNTVPRGMVMSDDICMGGKFDPCDP